MKRALLFVALAACGPKTAATPTPPPAGPDAGVPGISPGIASLAFLVGDWQSEDGKLRESWLAADGALYGVRFAPDGIEEDIIDDAGDGGALVRWSMAEEQVQGPMNVVDDPKKTGDATMIDSGMTWHRATAPSAPELEAADRAFAQATHDRGADGWADTFAPDGVNWGGGQLTSGHDAIRADIASLLEKDDLTWQPIASRMGPGGDVGFTVGTFAVIEEKRVKLKGSYQTVWKKQPDGSWKILADAGRREN